MPFIEILMLIYFAFVLTIAVAIVSDEWRSARAANANPVPLSDVDAATSVAGGVLINRHGNHQGSS